MDTFSVLREPIAKRIGLISDATLYIADTILAIPEIAAALRDAERYRWILDLRRELGAHLKIGNELDAAIDAAIEGWEHE